MSNRSAPPASNNGSSNGVAISTPPIGDLPAAQPAPVQGQGSAPQRSVPETRITDMVLLNRLRELRAEAQDLVSILADVRTGAATLGTYAPYITKTRSDIDAIMPYLANSENADAIRRILNGWEKMSVSPLLNDPTAPFDPKTLLNHLNILEGQARELIFQAAYLTVPDRLQQWLNKSRPGYYIPFHSIFQDEVPSEADRKKLLQYIGWAPEMLEGGLVDVTNGLVYRFSPSKWERRLSVVQVLASFLVATGSVIASCYLSIDGWPFRREHLPVFILSWVATIAGIAVHLLVGNAKQAQSPGSSPPVIAPSEFLARINANSGQLLRLIGLALIGFFIMAFTVGVSSGLVLSAFLAGYSLDSLLGLGAAGLDQQAAAQADFLKNKLGG